MTLAAGQMSYNGVTFGVGQPIGIVTVDGLTGLPNVRSGDVSRPNAHGLLAGYDFMGDRPVTLALEVVAGGGNTMPQNLELLRAALLVDTVASGGVNPTASQILVFNFGQGSGGIGVNRRICCRPRKVDGLVDVGFAAMQDPAGSFRSGVAEVAVLLDAADPLIYDATTQSASVGLSVATGGFTFPATFPATFGSQSGGLITAANAGTVAGPVYMTITGPCINPRVEQQTSGVTLQFNTTLGASDTLTVDTYAGTAILNGTASRQSVLAPGNYITAFGLQPGNNTVGFYSSDATATGATLTLEWSNTWA